MRTFVKIAQSGKNPIAGSRRHHIRIAQKLEFKLDNSQGCYGKQFTATARLFLIISMVLDGVIMRRHIQMESDQVLCNLARKRNSELSQVCSKPSQCCFTSSCSDRPIPESRNYYRIIATFTRNVRLPNE